MVRVKTIIAILTDSPPAQARVILKAKGLNQYVDHVFATPETGTPKPQKKAFTQVLDQYGLSAPKVIMIGDNEQLDIRPARALGMKAFHVFDSSHIKTHLHGYAFANLGPDAIDQTRKITALLTMISTKVRGGLRNSKNILELLRQNKDLILSRNAYRDAVGIALANNPFTYPDTDLISQSA